MSEHDDDCIQLHTTLVDGCPLVPWDHWQSDVPCGAYSNGTDGWACAATGPHDQHRNAAGDVTWGDA